MPIAPLEGRTSRVTTKQPGARRARSPWVAWIALSLGVFFTGTGFILLLWGLSWQSWSIAPKAIGEEELQGGPIILPLGAFCFVLGIMWLYQGWTGFRRPGEDDGTRVCPHCHRRVEEDLDFCYHCMEKLDRAVGGPTAHGRTSPDPAIRGHGPDLEGLAGGRRGQRK